MVIVTVNLHLKSDKVNDYITAFSKAESTVRAESGCIEYELFETDSSNTFFLFERWESREALDNHLNTAHMKTFFETVEDCFETEKQINIYEVIN